MGHDIVNNQEINAEENSVNMENETETADICKEIPENDRQFAEISEKLAECEDKYLRLAAEFDNYRKRTLKERYDLIKTAGEEVIKELLPVIDDFDRALEALKASGESGALSEGVQLIYDKFFSALSRKGLVAMDVMNADFDAEIHEAVAKIPASDEQKGKILDVVQKGYSLNDKIIRHPKVVIGE